MNFLHTILWTWKWSTKVSFSIYNTWMAMPCQIKSYSCPVSSFDQWQTAKLWKGMAVQNMSSILQQKKLTISDLLYLWDHHLISEKMRLLLAISFRMLHAFFSCVAQSIITSTKTKWVCACFLHKHLQLKTCLLTLVSKMSYFSLS